MQKPLYHSVSSKEQKTAWQLLCISGLILGACRDGKLSCIYFLDLGSGAVGKNPVAKPLLAKSWLKVWLDRMGFSYNLWMAWEYSNKRPFRAVDSPPFLCIRAFFLSSYCQGGCITGSTLMKVFAGSFFLSLFYHRGKGSLASLKVIASGTVTSCSSFTRCALILGVRDMVISWLNGSDDQNNFINNFMPLRPYFRH